MRLDTLLIKCSTSTFYAKAKIPPAVTQLLKLVSTPNNLSSRNFHCDINRKHVLTACGLLKCSQPSFIITTHSIFRATILLYTMYRPVAHTFIQAWITSACQVWSWIWAPENPLRFEYSSLSAGDSVHTWPYERNRSSYNTGLADARVISSESVFHPVTADLIIVFDVSLQQARPANA